MSRALHGPVRSFHRRGQDLGRNLFEVKAQETGSEEAAALVYQFADAANANDVNAYIGLFAEEIRDEMNKYVENYGNSDFFEEVSVNLRKLQILSEEAAECADYRRI